MLGSNLLLVFLYLVLMFCAQVVNAAGPLARLPNTSLTNMPSQPPSFGFTFTNALGSMTFTSPVVITSPPGETNRLFIVEKTGAIVVITNLATPNRTVFLNLATKLTSGADLTWSGEEGVLGLAFHPGYATNRYFYVFYTGSTNTPFASTDRNDILARYQTLSGNSNQADSASAQILFAQPDEAVNHNAGDLHFGPDGYLYVSLGDEGGAEGQYGNSQKITNDFFSGIIRIDVDKRGTNLPPNPHPALLGQTNYFVPADNPFVGATNFNGYTISSNQVRTEFWAVGLRNPWRFSFDTDGTLYCGDVGQGTVEEIDIINKGGNYGWNFFEGRNQRTNNAQLPPGFVHSPPVLEYGRTNGFAIIGGQVYRGQKFSQLYGSYIYGDSGSGMIWELSLSGTNVVENPLLMTDDAVSGYAGITAFGEDPRNKDLLYADITATGSGVGPIKRMIYNSTTNGAAIPPLLSNAGVFTNLTTLATATGIFPYDLNTPFWSDNAIKSRWFSVPNTNLTIAYNSNANWSFPTGTVWIKHFEVETTNGVAASRRRLETRLLIINTNGGYGVTYRWTIPPTNAILVAESGLDEAFTNYTAGGAILNTQVWHYPSRIECLQCHTASAGFALGFNTPQLNRDFTYAGGTTNQLTALSLAGYFTSGTTNNYLLRSLAHATNDAVSFEYRVRSYLSANCSQCHQPGGVSQALWDARITTPGPQNGVVNGTLFNNFGNLGNRVIVPGSLSNSVLFQRVANLGTGHMPPIATSVVNTQAVALLAAWITNELPSYVSYASWQSNYFGSTNSPAAAMLSDPDGDSSKNYLEYLTQTDPTNTNSAWKISISQTSGVASISFPQIANRGFEVQSTTNLFNSNSWSALNIPPNSPLYSISNRTGVIPEAISPGTAKYYRVRVFEP